MRFYKHKVSNVIISTLLTDFSGCIDSQAIYPCGFKLILLILLKLHIYISESNKFFTIFVPRCFNGYSTFINLNYSLYWDLCFIFDFADCIYLIKNAVVFQYSFYPR